MSDSEYKNQQHFYSSFDLGTAQSGSFALNTYVGFPIKKIKFNFAYVIESDLPVNYLVQSSVTETDTIGVLNKFSRINAADSHIFSVDRLSADTTIEHIYKDPYRLSNQINFRYNNATAGVTTYAASVFVHVEVLGL